MTLSDQLRLDGKRALVCGASQGIGKAAAVALAGQGASLLLLARSGDALASTLSELPTGPTQRHDIVIADLQDTETLANDVVRQLTNERPVHVLVNNSGGPAPGLASEAEPADFNAAFRQHVLAAQVLTTALLPGMQAMASGRIINVISTSVKEPIPGLGVSNTIRGAMAGWAKTMASELGPHGITVNNVLPGYTRTTRLQPIFEARARKAGCTVDEVEQQARMSVPLRRFAEPIELGYAIAFLASPAAAYINGINLPVDGGRTRSL